MRLLVLSSLLLLCSLTACTDKKRCEPDDRDACGDLARCVVDEDGEGFCEDLASCDPSAQAPCPGGFVCRPVASGGAVCEPSETAGRIPSCIDSQGIDVFAVEANSALSVTWNVNASLDLAGGFEVAYGTTSKQYGANVRVGADVREATLAPLPNGTPHFVAIRALSAGGQPTFTSCEVSATPHVLAFSQDRLVTAQATGAQQRSALASNLEGSRQYLAWEEGGRIALAQSTDFGNTWSGIPLTSGGTQTTPAVAIREAVFTTPTDGGTPTEVSPEYAFIAWQEGGSVRVARYRANGGFDAPVTVGSGTAPALAVGPHSVQVVYENGGTILHAASSNEGGTFSTPVKISGDTTNAHAPSIAVHPLSGDVAVGWHAQRGGGDSNVYFAASKDEGRTFGTVTRIDDDAQGLNQLNVSIAVDPRSNELYATWEDRRGGANVYFSLSASGGATWARNVDVGAGLGGDQFRPRAVVDVARNVYVTFQDTTSGARVVFTRFNATGSFDPPLQPSRTAGSGGMVGDRPAVATDRYGTVYLAWEENRGGPTARIVFSRAE
jgi:hypothetical protein